MNDLDYARLIRRGFLPVLLLVVIGAVGGLLVSRAATPLYDSSSAVSFSVAGARTSTDVNQGAMYIQTQMPTYAELATSPAVLAPVVQNLGLKATPSSLAGAITTTVPQDTAVLELSVESTSPGLARRVADAVASELSRAVVDSAPRLAGSATAVVTTSTIKSAVTPTAPSSPRTAVNVVAGALIGLLLGALLAIAFEYRRAARTTVASPRAGAITPSVDFPPLRDPAATGPVVTGTIRSSAPVAGRRDLEDESSSTTSRTKPTVRRPDATRRSSASSSTDRSTGSGAAPHAEDARR